jgi:proteasome lid subunit RPN8/RPN11
MMARIDARAWKAVREHSLQGYPNEMCGVLLGRVGDPVGILEAHGCANVNTERSRDRYLIDPMAQLVIEKDARARALDVVGYFHSHPDHPAVPSVTDLEFSWEDLLYLIVSVRDARVADRKVWMRRAGTKTFKEVELEAPAAVAGA